MYSGIQVPWLSGTAPVYRSPVYYSKQEITSSILVGALIFNLICRLLSLTPSHLHSNLKFQSN